MKRKIIKQGASTLTISLPSAWTKQYDLSPGVEIEVEQKGKDLIVSTEKTFHSQKSELKLEGDEMYLNWTYLNSVYIRGDEEIKVIFDNDKIKDMAETCPGDYLGFAVVEQGTNYFVIKELTETKDVELESIVRRIFILIKLMAEDSLIFMKKDDIKSLNELKRRDRTINSFVAFCLRTLNKKGYQDFQKSMLYSNIIILLEQLADEFHRLCRKIKDPLKKDQINMFEKVVIMVGEFYEAFYSYDKKKIKKIWKQRNELREKITKMMKKTCTINEAQFYYRVQKIAESIVDIIKVQIGLKV
ncbi:hypothetical protein ACFL1H_02360 [Nanoarchaeota archaeon]